jgi:DNA-directed RNA polymerase specialized sigma24 family protein
VQAAEGEMRGSTADERFVALVEREHRGLTAASALIVGDRSTAEEIVQDVLERTYRRWKQVDTYDLPGAWVRRAVVNQSISVARPADPSQPSGSITSSSRASRPRGNPVRPSSSPSGPARRPRSP